ncbi:O-succinylhomoserine sulfhydrylase [Rhodoblastus acidophilus]|uniref:O-succinylhomoserine sulfhydrylase n=1 Tax=Candidatus Rhodoblastus alkanivorans TaxID=2954117 RepID=A0ABS9ZB82_9HYPH|nr:O-succinylhomoserine sulfhydrylase [Candidatus Rhodoblastus alkanivorans]MCI4680043.1 O-succinylhomoserine sulfhydrylase [Candidatus Rhodoblastus alkanivorans]MCI4684791.1 O-succinylhomoserine sulfhydrylase [Candidatus Rhodoblastus alkanivorans]MDI4642115.1 O-succinylhomoserine sulfhydrylase [Rhodoblastus acidophilus]
MSAYDRPPLDATNLRPRTKMVHGGTMRSAYGETSEALFLTQGFVYNSAEVAESRFTGADEGYQYSRFGNPTVAMFEQRMALLEGAEAARATATGMAAVTTALMGQVRAGDHVVASRQLFGSCLYIVTDLLPRFGVESTLVDGNDLDQWKAALRPNTKTAFLESPTNPALGVLDIAAIAKIVHSAGATLVVDNVFAAALMQKPLELGADCVVYSATKHIDGQGRCLGGVVLGSNAFIETHVHNFIRQTGPSLSPFNAWVLLKGLETLPLRVAQQQDSAGKIADFLAGEKKIARVYYPGRPDHPQYELARRQMKGGSTMVAFDVAGGKAEAFRMANAFEIIKISNNLGDAKSLVTHPATTTHQRLSEEARQAAGIGPGMLRLSVGLEDVEDLIDDLKRGLAAA